MKLKGPLPLLLIGLVLVVLGIVSLSSSRALGVVMLVVAIGVLIASVRGTASRRG
ncbi:MAG: hypothetical protein ABI083_15575 [Lapillicoccus sp.]